MSLIISSPILIIAGPTASGKSHLAMDIAKKYKGVIINADSKQIYEKIPHITAQPSKQQQKEIEHVLYGFTPMDHIYSVGKWVKDAEKSINDARVKGKIPVIVGGTGMYIHALMEGLTVLPDITPDVKEYCRALYDKKGIEGIHACLVKEDPLMSQKIAPQDTARIMRALEVFYSTQCSLAYWQNQPKKRIFPHESFHVFVLHKPRHILYARAAERFNKMLQDNVLDEIEAVQKSNFDPLLPSMKSLGIAQLLKLLRGEATLEEAKEETLLQTRRYIKRQETWFRHQIKDTFWGEEEDIMANLKLY